jgi:hypothetical protein
MPDYLPAQLGMTYSEALAEAYASATAGDPALTTLELHHPAFSVPARVVSDTRDLLATLEATAPVDPSTQVTFTALPFRAAPPEQSDSGAPAPVQIEIDNISLDLADLLLQARDSFEPVQVYVREYLPSDTSAPHILPVLVMEMSDIALDVQSATAQLSFGNLTNMRWPAHLYTRERFPALGA